MVLAVEFAQGQIQLLNPSFEDGYENCLIGISPPMWVLCENGLFNCTLDTVACVHPSVSVIDGFYNIGIRTQGASYNGAIAQHLQCSIAQGVDYSVSFWISGYQCDANLIIKSGRAQIWLGNDTCARDFIIFESGFLDTVWEQHTITFTPNTDYSYFHICGLPQPNVQAANVLLDAFSPIEIINAHQIHSYATDTLLPIGSTTCLNLNAYTDTTYSRVWWEQVGVGLIDNQINAGTFCTDTNTTYIIHMLGKDSTCAGYLPSSDTVHVRFYDPSGVAAPPSGAGGLLSIFPNPTNGAVTITTEQNGSFEISDGLGRLVSTKNIERGNTTLSIEELPGGVYFYRFTTSRKIQQHGKLVKQ